MGGNLCKEKIYIRSKREYYSFETNDRYMDENGKGRSLVPWYVDYSDCKKQNGYFQPGSIQASWVLHDEDDAYLVSGHIEISDTIKDF